MQTKQVNDFVDFIRQYDITSADYTKIFDEYTKTVQFEVKSSINEMIINKLKTNPSSVIITGNAGDGKTRICRNVYEALKGSKLESWSRSGVETIEYKGKRFHIVKDLSELSDEKIYNILDSLVSSIHSNNDFYVIAANEGKLTYSLYSKEEYKELIEVIEPQFSNVNFESDAKIKLYNLLHTSTSIFAQKIIEEWNSEENWSICNSCSVKNKCILNHNHQQLSKENVLKRIFRLYQSLDALEVHMTMRELLIQLAYVHLGGLNCKDIHEANSEELRKQSNKVYYQNLFGVNIDADMFNDIPGITEIKKFDPGRSSHSTIDDFIMNGDLADESVVELHHSLYGTQIDTDFGYFTILMNKYRTNKELEIDLKENITNFWLPRLRRKYFFEAKHKGYQGEKLLPFKYRRGYIQNIEQQKEISLEMREKIVQGLNNYFSKQLVYSPENALYVVSEKLFVYRIVNFSDIVWETENSNSHYDRRASVYYIRVGEARLKIDLSVFEYLCRIADGGLRHILHEDVEIRLQNFKNKLISTNVFSSESLLQILKYDRKRDAYMLRKIEILNETQDTDDW